MLIKKGSKYQEAKHQLDLQVGDLIDEWIDSVTFDEGQVRMFMDGHAKLPYLLMPKIVVLFYDLVLDRLKMHKPLDVQAYDAAVDGDFED
jgi:hypothetical protein